MHRWLRLGLILLRLQHGVMQAALQTGSGGRGRVVRQPRGHYRWAMFSSARLRVRGPK